MSFGRPAIAHKLVCISELVPPGAGILYDPNNEKGLEQALIKAFMSDATRMGAHAYEVAKTLDWDEAANIVLSAYRSNT